jgi:hypothetical protein
VADFGLFDPTLDLSNFKFPTLDLLKEYSTGGITINQEELEENKTELYTAQLQNRNCTNKSDRWSIGFI